MRQVLEVLRRRIDDPATGVPESVVTRQGDNRVLIQIPGGESERERMVQAIQAGANHYCSKPFTPEDLTVKILECLGLGG